MTPKEEAIKAVADALQERGVFASEEIARIAVEAAEKAWPHKAPEKDVSGTTNGSYDRAWAPTHRFGFGKPTAC